MKTCTTCKLTKDDRRFYVKNENGKKRLCSECSQCMKSKRNALNKKRGPEHFRRYTLNRACKSTNITVDQAFQALKDQDYKCKICNISETTLNKKLCLDHCHKTGQFRGMLCNSCNVGLANFRDSIESLTNAVAYLQKEKG